MFGKRKTKIETAETKERTIPAESEIQRKDTALIAVIAAAIAASLGTSTNGIVIRSLRRASASKPKWGEAGREQQINPQF